MYGMKGTLAGIGRELEKIVPPPHFPMKLAVPAKGGCFSMGYDPYDIIKDDPAQGTRCIIGFPGPLNFKETLEQLTCFKASRYGEFWTPLEIVFLYISPEVEKFLGKFGKGRTEAFGFLRFSWLTRSKKFTKVFCFVLEMEVESDPLVKLILRFTSIKCNG